MAISIDKYIDISTTFPAASVSGRSFGGLVFTKNSMADDMATSKKYEQFENGEIVQLTLDEVEDYFKKVSKEYEFAAKYYGYLSPSGRFASKISFAKILDSDEDAAAAFARIADSSNMFGSFTFLNLPNSGGSVADDDAARTEMLLAVAAKNSEQKYLSRFLFVVNDVRGSQTAQAVADKCGLFRKFVGTCFVSGYDECSAYMPMAIFAATDYDNGSVNVQMFKQFDNETPTVKSDTEYDILAGAQVNFYGRTQTNGQSIDFYQRGFNTDEDKTDTAIYCNEIWFKSACETALINTILSEERIPASNYGVAIVRSEVLGICANAAANGTFMEKELTTSNEKSVRKLVASINGTSIDADVVISGLRENGYAVLAYLVSQDDEYIIHYYVFYGTADSIRFIKGDDILVK